MRSNAPTVKKKKQKYSKCAAMQTLKKKNEKYTKYAAMWPLEKYLEILKMRSNVTI